MTDQELLAIQEHVTRAIHAAVPAAVAPMKAALIELLREQSMQLGTIEDKISALAQADIDFGARLTGIENQLSQVKARLDRLGRDTMMGRTRDAEIAGDFERRIAALEAAPKPQ